MKLLTPLLPSGVAETAAWHGGNGYRGPGAWQHPGSITCNRKRFTSGGVPLSATQVPLDLTGLLYHQGDRGQNNGIKSSSKSRKRLHLGKAGALPSRLESLSPLLAPSHGFRRFTPVASVHSSSQCDLARSAEAQDSLPVCIHPSPISSDARGVYPHGAGSDLPSGIASVSAAESWSTKPFPSSYDVHDFLPRQHGRTSNQSSIDAQTGGNRAECGGHEAANRDFSVQMRPNTQPCALSNPSELRVPSAAVKMALDDMCNAQVLDARSALRVVAKERAALEEAMLSRRLETCLRFTSRRKSDDCLKRQYQPPQQRGRRRRIKKRRSGKAVTKDEGRRQARIHPLLFITEADLQKVELNFMLLEDAEAAHLLKFEEARRRQQDYETYYNLALRYGVLSNEDFGTATSPGKLYHNRISDAARVIQNWWWSTWPPVLRRRKTAALAIQSVFRGFVQRRNWHSIIRLRTLWGSTRIVAHAFVCWRDHVAKARRVAICIHRFRNRCAQRSLVAWACLVDAERKARDDVIRRRLKRVKEGLSLRVFEAWVRYAETSLAVKRMRRRICARPVLRAWRERASADRVCNRLRWSCAMLASRLLRWRYRNKFLDHRRACCKIQRAARRRIGRVRVRRGTSESRTRRAEEVVQVIEDKRLRTLGEAEQDRRDRLQAKLDEHKPRIEQSALAFLQTSAGKIAVNDKLSRSVHAAEKLNNAAVAVRGAIPTTVGVAGHSTMRGSEARREVIRQFILREQASLRHDFNAQWPPPLRCHHAECHATFIDLAHYARHAADAHRKDNPGIAELGLALSEFASLRIFESFLEMSGIVDRNGGRVVGANSCIPQVHLMLSLWKAIERWRAIPSALDQYQQLAADVYDILELLPPAWWEETPGSSTGGSVGCEESRSAMVGETRSATHLRGEATDLCGHWGRANKNDQNGHKLLYAVDPLVLEAASWRALTALSEAVGSAFLESAPYLQHLKNANRPFADAVAVVVRNITEREREEWLAEARTLREAAFRHNEEVAIDGAAEEVLHLMLGGADTGMLGSLIADQAELLAVVILAERGAFTKIISAVWNDVVDEAARIYSRQKRGVPPAVAGAVSEAVCSIARSKVMDDLIDECVVDLTKPGGAMWPDERTAAAVAEGVVYRVRGDIVEGLLEITLAELSESGEAKRLMPGAGGNKNSGKEQEQQMMMVDTGAEIVADCDHFFENKIVEKAIGEETGDSRRKVEGEGHISEATPSKVESRHRQLGQESITMENREIESGKQSDDDESNDVEALEVGRLTNKGNGRRTPPGEEETGSGAAATAAVVGQHGANRGRTQLVDETESTALSSALVCMQSTPPNAAGPTPLSSAAATSTVGQIELYDPGTARFDGGNAGVGSSGSKTFETSTIVAPSAEERAAAMMQSALRRKVVYRETKAMIARKYVKLYDPGYATFYWYNQTSGESTWEKPAIIDLYFKKPAASAVKAINHFAISAKRGKAACAKRT